MKKLLILFILLALNLPVSAYAPNWNEICPSEYLNASTQHNPLSYILRNTRENNKEADYWVNRKIDFENQLLSANNIPQEQREIYYNQIRAIELNKNNTHYQNQQNYIAKQGLMLQKFNTIQTMWTNTSLQGINNNLNGIRYGY